MYMYMLLCIYIHMYLGTRMYACMYYCMLLPCASLTGTQTIEKMAPYTHVQVHVLTMFDRFRSNIVSSCACACVCVTAAVRESKNLRPKRSKKASCTY